MEALRNNFHRVVRILPAPAALAVATMALSCGGDGSSSAPPSRITISPAVDVVLVGESVQLTAFVGEPSASPAAPASSGMPTNWSVDLPMIAGLDSTGRLLGLSNGRATIRATIGDGTAALPVRVATRFAGDWIGTYAVTDCERDGLFELTNLCSAVKGAVSPVSWSFVQKKLDVSGTLSLGGGAGSGTATGAVVEDGGLSWTASRFERTQAADISVAIASKDSRIVNGSLIGTSIEVWTIPNSPGSAKIFTQFVMTPAPVILPIPTPAGRGAVVSSR